MDKWYYSMNGVKHGPVAPAELKRVADSGQLAVSDFVWKKGLPNWVSPAKVRGLMPSRVAASNALPDLTVSAAPPSSPEELRRRNRDDLMAKIYGWLVLAGAGAGIATYAVVVYLPMTAFIKAGALHALFHLCNPWLAVGSGVLGMVLTLALLPSVPTREPHDVEIVVHSPGQAR